jgi:MerR family redox-sensitive transcriptional activator SoxR
MRIGELSRRSGLAPSAIRFYEQERLIPAAARHGGQRVYGEDAVAQLSVARLARDAGFRISEIRQLVTEFGENRWRTLAERKLGEVRSAAERLRTMEDLLEKLLRCRCPDLEFCGRAIERRASGNRTGPGRRKRIGRSVRRRRG